MKKFCLFVFGFIFFLTSQAIAQDKVVVIPLFEEKALDPETLKVLCRGYDLIGQKPPVEYNCPPKIVFLTSISYQGNLGGVVGADWKCQSLANQSELTKGRTFRAWLTAPLANPNYSFVHSQTPYVQTCKFPPHYGVVAQNWDDLTDGTLNESIRHTEQGCSTSGPREVWTNTDLYGLPKTYDPISTCGAFWSNDGGLTAVTGSDSEKDRNWTDGYSRSCAEWKHLYCIEQ